MSKQLFTIEAETKRFNDKIDRFIKRSPLAVGVVIRKLALELLTRIILKNPVDTGRSRAGWFAAFNALGGQGLAINIASSRMGKRKYKSKSAGMDQNAVSEGMSKGRFIDRTKDLNPYVEVVNGVNYTIYLEYGHSKQAPVGMVRISMREMTSDGKAVRAIKDGLIKEWNTSGL